MGLTALLVAAPWCAPAADPVVVSVAAQDARAAAQAATRSLGLQTELPGDRAIKPEEPPDPEAPSSFSPLRISPEAARIVLWMAVIAFVLVALFSLRDTVWSSSRSRRFAPDDPDAPPSLAVAARMDQAQLEADELARRGNFAEAMHVLLLQSVGELRRRLDVSIAASLTSREILHRIGLGPEERTVFADIISRVEISYFGAHEPDESEYLACRQSFESLTLALMSTSRGSAA